MEHEFRIRAEIVSARTQAAQHPADSTSDADTTSRSVALESGLGANDEIHGCTVVPCESADGSVGAVSYTHLDVYKRQMQSLHVDLLQYRPLHPARAGVAAGTAAIPTR